MFILNKFTSFEEGAKILIFLFFKNVIKFLPKKPLPPVIKTFFGIYFELFLILNLIIVIIDIKNEIKL